MEIAEPAKSFSGIVGIDGGLGSRGGGVGGGFAANPVRLQCSPKCTHCSPHHYDLVSTYRSERERQLAVAEDATLGYSTEMMEYTENNPPITFKDWLVYGRRAS